MTTSLYESAYTGTGRLFQQPCEDMRRMLSLSSRGVLSECHEPPDHVSIELALLADRLRYRDERLVARLCTSLRGWTPELARACGECDSSGFYAGVTRLLVAALNRLTASINGRRPQNSDLSRTHHVIPN
jgi:TorA-specific chaperone